MNVIFSTRSTNGRWGLDVVSASYRKGPHPENLYEVILDPDGRPVNFPLRGLVTDLGEVDGVRVLRIEHDPEAMTWLAFGHVVSGGKCLVDMSLQSHRSITANVIGPVAVMRSYGYRGRSSTTYLVKEGVEQELSPSQLLALGLIEPDQAPAETAPAQPEPVDTVMLAKLKKVGLL